MANYTQKGYDLSLNGYWKGTTSATGYYGYPKNYWQSDSLRNLYNAFGNFFNDFWVVRENEYGEPIKLINVPIKFGPRLKAFDFRVEQETGKKYYISYPNLTYRFESMELDRERFSGRYVDRTFYADELETMGVDYTMSERFWSDVQPVPYNVNIVMELKCDLIDDAEDITEHICARFSPSCYLNIKEFWFFNKRRSIKLTLNGAPSFSYESESMGEEDKREITVTFNFTAATYCYKPIKSGIIIDKINTYVAEHNINEDWKETIMGNYDGSLSSRYNFEELYHTKVDYVSALAEPPTVVHDTAKSAYYTSYKYEATDELTFYPVGSKLLKGTSAIWNDELKDYEITHEYYDIKAYGHGNNNVKFYSKQLYSDDKGVYEAPYIVHPELVVSGTESD